MMQTNPQAGVKKWSLRAAALLLLLGACTSSAPSLITFATESGATQYFFPMMEWEIGKNSVSAICDITYRHEPGSGAVCNISFTAAGKTDISPPALPSVLYFTADGIPYAVRDISLLFHNVEHQQTRITSILDGDDLLAVLRSASITLNALIDGKEYQYTPPKRFLLYRDKFLENLANRDRLDAEN
ncbi:MAG: hypothetical protein LBK02_00060 [Treponema sp.]|nr:hypothetical protein [Treponema sp.]